MSLQVTLPLQRSCTSRHFALPCPISSFVKYCSSALLALPDPRESKLMLRWTNQLHYWCSSLIHLKHCSYSDECWLNLSCLKRFSLHRWLPWLKFDPAKEARTCWQRCLCALGLLFSQICWYLKIFAQAHWSYSWVPSFSRLLRWRSGHCPRRTLKRHCGPNILKSGAWVVGASPRLWWRFPLALPSVLWYLVFQ